MENEGVKIRNRLNDVDLNRSAHWSRHGGAQQSYDTQALLAACAFFLAGCA
jgi:hypothetical protein